MYIPSHLELEFEHRPYLTHSLPQNVSDKLHQHLLKIKMGIPLIRKSIMVSAIEVATRDQIWPLLDMKPRIIQGPNGRVFKSFNTGQCFHDAFDSLKNAEANMVPFLLFSDGETQSHVFIYRFK